MRDRRGMYPFQFQTGSIKSKSMSPVADATNTFQFKLVRLKVLSRFNTSLRFTVSIPNWFD